jgi:hypothetical protein
MMALNPTQLETVREICQLPGGQEGMAAVESLCAPLTDEQITQTIADIAEWMKVRLNVTNVLATGGGDNTEIIREEKRKLIRHTLRLRLGLSAVSATEAEESGGMTRGVFRAQTGRKPRSRPELV